MCLVATDGEIATMLEITIIHVWDVVGCASLMC